MRSLAFVFSAHCYSRYPPIVVARILARTVDQQILLLIDQVVAVKLPHLEIGRQLNGISRARLFAITAKDATREVDPKELWIPPPRFVLGCLQRDAIHRAGYRAQVARHAAL